MGQDDTICAIATPAGVGSIGIIRASGRDAFSIIQPLFRRYGEGKEAHPTSFKSHVVYPGIIIDPATGKPVDEVLVLPMQGPRSYTGEDVVEIQAHGNPHLLQRILSLLIANGARMATPGEFTRRAFLSGRIDLSQAEAVMDLIMAQSRYAEELAMHQLRGGVSAHLLTIQEAILSVLSRLEASIDFQEQGINIDPQDKIIQGISQCNLLVDNLLAGYEAGKQIRDGSAIVITGRPNVGKSSVMNRLLGEDRAIVMPIPGTTRDTLSEWFSIQGHRIQIIDTAGVHTTTDPIEVEGIRRGEAALQQGDLALFIVDSTQSFTEEDAALWDRIPCKKKVMALNKKDLHGKIDIDAVRSQYPNDPIIYCSAKTGEGFSDISTLLFSLLVPKEEGSGQSPLIAQLRQKNALNIASATLKRAEQSAREHTSVEFIAADLREALDSLGEIWGETTTDEILNQIFGQFCIGK